jgi:hypothetical protein
VTPGQGDLLSHPRVLTHPQLDRREAPRPHNPTAEHRFFSRLLGDRRSRAQARVRLTRVARPTGVRAHR